MSRQIRKEVANVLSNSRFPLNQLTTIANIENFSWDRVLQQMDSLAPFLTNVLRSAVTNKSNKDSLIRGKSVNLKPQLGTVIATLLHVKAPRKASFLPTLLSVQFWRGGLKRETIKQLSHTGICVGYEKTLSTVDKISQDFDAAAKRCKVLIEEQANVLKNVDHHVDQDLELSIALAATVPNIEDEETILFSDDESEAWQTEGDRQYFAEWQRENHKYDNDDDDDIDEDDDGNDVSDDSVNEDDDDEDEINDDNIDCSELVVGDTILYSDENMDESENAVLPSEEKEEAPQLHLSELSMVLESEDAVSQIVQEEEMPPFHLSFEHESVDPVTQPVQEIEQSKVLHKSLIESLQPGFTLCWDNVGKKVVTRHPTATTTNSYINMALSYMAINRVFTTPLPNTDINTLTKAVDIPVEVFVPNDKDFSCLRSRMEVIVGRILTRHFRWFRENFSECSTPHIVHDHFIESSQKSVSINLGVSDENPSTTQGAIGIYEDLQKYVPAIDSKPFTSIVYGDGLSCERGNDAHRARANGLNPWERLEGCEPAAQEFHKEMLLLQDFYDEFFKGSSAADRGTLCQLKNLYNFRKVKADISDNFNYAWELMCLNTEGFVCLLAMGILNIDSLESEPEEAPVFDDSILFEEKSRYLESVCSKLVKKIWHEMDTASLRKDDDQGIPLLCCGEDKDDELIECGERANCPNGDVFHYSCVGI